MAKIKHINYVFMLLLLFVLTLFINTFLIDSKVQNKSEIKLSNTFKAGNFFGKNDEMIVHTFYYRNKHPFRISIEDISKSCNCTDVQVSQREIDPSQNVDITLTVKPVKSVGNYRVIGMVKFAHREATEDFTIEYAVHPEILIEPSTVHLGRISPLEDNSHVRKVVSAHHSRMASPDDRRTLEERPGTPRLETRAPIVAMATGQPAVTMLDNGSIWKTTHQISITLGPLARDLAYGTHSSPVIIRFNDDAVGMLNVVWELDSSLAVSPDPLSFGYLKRSSEKGEAYLEISSRDRSSFEIHPEASGPIKFSVEDEKNGPPIPNAKSKNRHKLKLELDVGQLREVFNSGALEIRTTHQKQSRLQVNWSAILEPERSVTKADSLEATIRQP